MWPARLYNILPYYLINGKTFGNIKCVFLFSVKLLSETFLILRRTERDIINIQGIHKRMVRFQKLTRNLFLTLHGHNVHRQQQQLSKFLLRYQQFVSHAYCGAAGPVSKMASQQEKAFCVFRCEVSRSVITLQPFPTATPSSKLAPRPRSKHEKRTAGSA